MTTTESGREAEDLVAKHLAKQGYKVLGKNWRSRWCEIDIVASLGNKVYFVEVKYRKNANWGDGVDAITAKKLTQMSFAAELWVSNNSWQGDYELMVASVGGDPPTIEHIIEL